MGNLVKWYDDLKKELLTNTIQNPRQIYRKIKMLKRGKYKELFQKEYERARYTMQFITAHFMEKETGRRNNDKMHSHNSRQT